ncbi:bifunctional tetrahydrofolate synthase/dihydrofolate synthase [Bordetella sp. 2513F-2]
MPAPRLDAATPLPQWLEYLESIHAKPIDLGLDRVRQVADRLALRLDAIKFVVGGTNGKGSTCAMLEAILLAAGYKVGLYTSPHLIDFNERARVNGEIASDAALAAQFAAVEAARGDVSLTYFEFTTLAILRLFSESALDAVVLEVGLGGRLDAVNIVDADCAIVTSVDLDHMDYLGDTREQIGYEKAHIFRPGTPAICSDPVPPQSLLDHAQSIGADLWLFGRDFNYSGDRQQWAYGGRSQRRPALAYPALRGANQLLNASAALAALESVRNRLPVPQQAVRVGLLQASLPGRFQILPGQPLVILDVAHNPHAAAVLAQNLDNMGFHPYTYAVFGMLSDKDVAAVVGKLAGRIDHWFCAGLPGPRGRSPHEMAQAVQGALPAAPAGGEAPGVQACADPAAAFAAARERAGEGDRIVVFGSFLTVAAVLQALGRKG